MRGSFEIFVIMLVAIIGGLGVGLPRIDGFGGEETAQAPAQDEASEDDNQADENSAENASNDGSAEDATEASGEGADAQTQAPIVDLMRFDGNLGIVSGLAAAGSTVLIMNGDQELARTTANSDGEFATSFDFETPAEGAILQVISEDENGNRIAANEALTVLPQDAGDTATATLTDEGVEVEQGTSQTLALGELSYGSTTPMGLAGTAAAGAIVDVFINGEKIGSTTADENGQWSLEADPIEPGEYELALSENGSTPLSQSISLQGNPEIGTANASATGDASGEEATQTAADTGDNATTADSGESVSAASAEAGQEIQIGDRKYTVKRGDSLWRIAEQYYGEGQGYRYTEIFDVNASQINNPDLIYPEQNFDIPLNE